MFWERISDFPLFHAADHSLHTARYATRRELRLLAGPDQNRETSLLVGVDQFGRNLKVRSTDARPELGHIQVCGPTRCGKGLWLTEQLRRWKGSAIVNDIKGDLSELTAEERAKDGKVVFIDPRGVGSRYDPLQSRTTEDELRSSADQLLFDPNEGQGAIFTKRAAKMLTQLFRGARLEGHRPIPYAAHLIHLGPIEAAARLDTVSKRKYLSPDKNLATRFLDAKFEDANFTDPFLQSSWSTLSTKMDPIITETVIKSIAGSDFSPKELLIGEKPVTVYLRFPELHLLALSPLIRLIWSSLFEEVCNIYDSYPRNIQKTFWDVFCGLDELGSTPIPKLPEYAATVAGRGMTICAVFQSITQADAVYGTKRAETLRDNMATKIFYRPANVTTAEYIEKSLGYKSAYAHSKTVHKGYNTSEGESEQRVPLLSAWEIQRLPDTDIIGFHRDLPPFRAKRIDGRKIGAIAKRTPLQLPPLPDAPEIPPLLEGAGIGVPELIDPDQRH